MAKAAPTATLAPNHLFYAPSADGPARAGAAAPGRSPACSCRIAMLDTGVEPRHPSLAGIKVRQRAFAAETVTPAAHGSAVASLMFGQENGASQLYVADVFGGSGGKAGAATVVIRGLEWLAATGASVINISLAGPSNPVVEAIIAKMSRSGTVIVAAVGNDGPAAPPAYPAAQPEVVAVTAVDSSDKIYRYAVRGRHVAFAAAGVLVTAAAPQGGYARVTGTSFAAPVVAGRIARMMAASPNTDGREVVRRLQSSAVDLGAPGRDAVFGYGVIRANPR
jgi:subtilisin family serine protease